MTGDTYTVMRTATMDAPPDRVYEQIVDFRNWTTWSPWEDIDPQLARTYSGSPEGPGAVYAWSGNRRAGQGRMEITQAEPASRIVIDLVFEKPWKARNETVFTLDPVDSGTRVTWSMTGKKTLMTRMMGIVTPMDKLIGKDFDKGLARLSAVTGESANS